jgi:hypothetical protein
MTETVKAIFAAPNAIKTSAPMDTEDPRGSTSDALKRGDWQRRAVPGASVLPSVRSFA